MTGWARMGSGRPEAGLGGQSGSQETREIIAVTDSTDSTVVLLLGAFGYSLARDKDYNKWSRARALASLETNFTPSCP